MITTVSPTALVPGVIARAVLDVDRLVELLTAAKAERRDRAWTDVAERCGLAPSTIAPRVIRDRVVPDWGPLVRMLLYADVGWRPLAAAGLIAPAPRVPDGEMWIMTIRRHFPDRDRLAELVDAWRVTPDGLRRPAAYIARMAGCSPAAVARFIDGGTMPETSVWLRLVMALDLDHDLAEAGLIKWAGRT